MIETQILGSAVGIQRQAVIDKTESTPLPSLTNGVIIGRFKRGRLDKPFKVTSENYQALLGRDPKNASYLAVEDAFKRGVSEVTIMRVGSTSKSSNSEPVVGGNCAPTNTKFRFGNSKNYYITASVNNGERTSLLLRQTDGIEMLLISIAELFNSGDENSICFLSPTLTSLGVEVQQSPEVGNNPALLIEFSGFASDGAVMFYDKSYNIKDLAVASIVNGEPTAFSVEEVIPAQTIIALHPTEGVIRDEDLYYSLDSANDNGDPVIMKSCAKAILGDVLDTNPAPTTCLPSMQFFDFDENNPNVEPPIGLMVGRYRVNGGEWHTYEAWTQNTVNGLACDFFDSILLGGNRLIYTGSEGRLQEYPTAFSSFNGRNLISGARATGDRSIKQVANTTPTTIEFATTSSNNNDLVYLIFGENITLYSCAFVYWQTE